MTKTSMVKKIQLTHCNGRAMNLKTLLLTLSQIGSCAIKTMYLEDEHLVFVEEQYCGSSGELEIENEGAWNLNKLNLIDQEEDEIAFFYSHLMPDENPA